MPPQGINSSVFLIYFTHYLSDVFYFKRILIFETNYILKQLFVSSFSAIKAVHGDWSVDDCLEFQKMVVGMQFVALVQHIDPNVANPSDKIVGLRLIDTSSSRDVYIDQELVDQKRAFFIN